MNMKNTFGTSVAVTLFGESHGEYIGAVIDGLAPGIEIHQEYISHMLTQRRPSGKISTSRKEKDEYKIVSGVVNGKTTGTPITIFIPNENVKSGDYAQMKTVARPSHADYTADCKYHGFQDSRGGGHFSGRITAALVAAGAMSFEDGLVLVSKRAMAMQKACELSKGSMAAVLALPTEKVEEICDRLENYAVIWKINGNRWLENWTAHPKGLGGQWDEAAQQELELLNQARAAATEPLWHLREGMRQAKDPALRSSASAAYPFHYV